MIPILAKQAVMRKVDFPNAKMTGNYECAYALGILSARLGMELNPPDSLIVIHKEVCEKLKSYKSEGERLNQLIKIIMEYEPSDKYDEQMKELYLDGYEENNRLDL